jgi:predicted methyltransferase
MRLTEKVHALLAAHLKEGDLAIDATAGNGYDTLFLAEKVGASGQVIAIDIQESALQSTRNKLLATDLDARVLLHCADHSVQLNTLLITHSDTAAAIVFNLGYLPGSDKSIQTAATTTKSALDAAQKLLRAGGRLCVTAYRGHPGGMEEAAIVEDWMHAHEESGSRLECHIPNSNNTPPILWVLENYENT